VSRWLFGTEPEAVVGQIERDPDMKVDRLVSALLRFPNGQASFTCGGQLAPYQRMNVFGTTARIDVEIPFNSPSDRPARIYVDDGSKFAGAAAEAIEFPLIDQYRVQADQFSDAVRGVGELPVTLEDSIANMAAIDAVFRSAVTQCWETPVGV
jgi:predicted dehydrogenase